MFQKLCGWIENPVGIKQYASKVGGLTQYGLSATEQKDVYLWKPLLEFHPTWKRGAQGIGDCVSWGAELAETMLLAIQAKLGISEWIAEVSTEANYGGARVEALNKTRGGYSDGAFGFAQADWALKWGALLRIDYSKQTGNPEHDLRVYSADKAKAWGNFGCGGEKDKGLLDAIAKQFPVRGVAQVKTIEDVIASIYNGYPVTVASMAGFGDMERNQDGIVRMNGQWAHQMMVGGIKWFKGKPIFRLFQSWGNSCGTKNDPGIDDVEISKCSWWIVESDLKWILDSGDCWSYADIAGFPPRKLDFLNAAKTWG